MDKNLIWLLPIAFLLFSFKKKETKKAACIITDPDPIYGGSKVMRVRLNTRIFESPNESSKVIFTKSCYVELLGNTQGWYYVVNRTAFGEPDFYGWIRQSDVAEILMAGIGTQKKLCWVG